MRNVNFLEVGMENFGPYIDPMILTFKNDSLTLLTGPNGIGKTLSLDALPFTLFGSTTKGAKGDDVVNNVVGRNCHTWVKFTIDKDMYLVDRYHKYTKLGNTVTISKNGDEPFKKGQKEVLPEIEKILCPKKSFMNTLMFGQKVKDFFTDLVDSDKKEIFRKILNLSRYQLFYDRAKEILTELKESIMDLTNRTTVAEQLQVDADQQLEILNNQKKDFFTNRDDDIRNLGQAIVTNERMLDQWQTKLLKLQKNQQDWKDLENRLLELEAKEEKFNNLIESERQTLISNKGLKLAELSADAEKAKQLIKDESYKRAERKKDYFIKMHGDLTDQIEKLLEEKNKIGIEMNSNEDIIANCEVQEGELRTGLNTDTCPTCLQVITEECQNVLKEKIKEFNDIIDMAKNTIIDQLKPARKKILHEVEKLSDKKQQAKEIMEVDIKDAELFAAQGLLKINEKLNNAFEKVEQLTGQHLNKIEENYQSQLSPIFTERDQLMKQTKTHQSLDKEVDDMEMTVKTIERTILQKKLDLKAKEALEFDDTQIFSYEKKKRVLTIEIENLFKETETKREDIEIFEFWKTAFSSSGIPSMLIDEAIPFMNQKVSEYLDKLTNGRYIVSFDTLAETKKGEFRDKISVNVLDTHTRASSRIQLSGGQTRIIDIATILTLGDLQSNIQHVKFNILLFDEIFDSLDEENIGFVSKVLSNMKVGKSIYLISHRHEDQLEADEVLTLN